MLSHVRLLVILWTIACQAPLSKEFSNQEYWSGLSFPPPGDVPDSGIEPMSLALPALAGGFFTTVPPGKPKECIQFSSVQSLSRVQLFVIPGITACQASLSITNCWSSLKLTSIESVCHPAISSSVVPFSSCPQSSQHQSLFQ